ncbi:hypothetical protein [Streptomyces sp. CAS3]
MADTIWEGPGFSSDNGTGPADGASASTGRVWFSLARWALAPRTTWQARRLAVEFAAGVDARTAWVMARLARHPEEHVYAMRHLDREEGGS